MRNQYRKMKPGTTFQERAEIAMEQLAKQPPVTLEYARAQCLWLKSPKNPEVTILVIEHVLILDQKIKEEKDSTITEKLLQEKSKVMS